MNKKIALIFGLGLAVPLLTCAPSVYAATSDVSNTAEITPSVSYLSLVGDKDKLAEDYWTYKGVAGGASDFSVIREDKNGLSIEMEGKATAGEAGNNDYDIDLSIEKAGLGEINFEFNQYRKYYDGTGGYYSNLPVAIAPVPFFETERSLFMDIGDLKVEGILDKEGFPKLTASYEREYRQGSKSTLNWGSAVSTAGLQIKILPAYLITDEVSDKLYMKIEQTIKGFDISAEQTWENINTRDSRLNDSTRNLFTGLYTTLITKNENVTSDIYTTVVRVSKELNEKVLTSVAFLYNYYRSHENEKLTDQFGTSYNAPFNAALTERNTVTVMPNVAFTLSDNLIMDAGMRWEYDNTNGNGTWSKDKTASPGDGAIDEDLVSKSDIMENKIGESLNLKYDGFKNVVVYGGLELEQEMRNRNENQNSYGKVPVSTNFFGIDQDVNVYDSNYTVGCKFYPIEKIDVTTEFKYRYGIWDYRNASKSNKYGDVSGTYNGFIDSLSFTSYKPLVIFNFKPVKQVKCSFRYALDNTVYGLQTPIAKAVEPAQYLSNVYTASITFTPYDPLYLTFDYQYKQASTKTMANGDGGPLTSATTGLNIPTYNANVRTLGASCGYSPVKNLTLTGSYSLARADNFNNFSVNKNLGLPLGLDNLYHSASLGFEDKITANCSLDFRYDFMQYAEYDNNGMDNYIGNLFSAAVKTKF